MSTASWFKSTNIDDLNTNFIPLFALKLYVKNQRIDLIKLVRRVVTEGEGL